MYCIDWSEIKEDLHINGNGQINNFQSIDIGLVPCNVIIDSDYSNAITQ